jgi:FixJ family two-component response regulator
MAGKGKMDGSVVLVTRSVPVRDTLERVLAKAGLRVEYKSCMEAGCALAREGGCVLLCTAEQDWRRFVDSSNLARETGRPVILVIPTADKPFCAEAIQSGALDVIALAEQQAAIVDHVVRAKASWEWLLLFRDALRQA